MYFESSLDIPRATPLEDFSTQIEELNAQLEIINEDRIRLRDIIENLLTKNSKLDVHYELLKRVITREQTRNEILEAENRELKKDMDQKNNILNNFKSLLAGLSPKKPPVNRRHNSVGEANALNSRPKRRPIVTMNPSGFTQSFYK